MKRLLTFLISIALLAAIPTSCSTPGNENASAAAPSAGAGSGAESGGEPAEPDLSPITMTMFINAPTGTPDAKWGEDDISRTITEKTGVTLDIQYATSNDHIQLSTMLASGVSLPDFIRSDHTAPPAMQMVDQGFVLPLNELADQYCPEFWENMPMDMDVFFAQDDGNLYFVTSWFGDVSRLDETKYYSWIGASTAIHEPMYKEIGSPPMDTLDEFTAMLKTAKEHYPDLPYIFYDMNPGDPLASQSCSNIFYRIFGGDHYIVLDEDTTTATTMITDERYLSAIKYINSLYREGLYQRGNFTVKSDEFNAMAQNEQIFFAAGQWYNIACQQENGPTTGPYIATEWPQAPGVPRETQKRNDEFYSVTNFRDALYITKDTQDPARAVQFISFLMSDDGASLQRLGIEGEHWYMAEDNHPRTTEALRELQKNDPEEAAKVGIFGIGDILPSMFWDRYNVVNWLEENGPHGSEEYIMSCKYSHNERLQGAISVITDEDVKTTYLRVMEVWKNSLPNMYLAESEEACEQAYETFVSEATRTGLDELEEYYTQQYVYWKDRIENTESRAVRK